MQHASIRITPRQIALVRESFAKIVPIREAAAALFYSRLFASNPGTRPLFRGDIKSQGVKLMTARPEHPLAKSRTISLETFCSYDHVLVSPTGGSFEGPTDDALALIRRRRTVRYSVPSFLLVPELLQIDDLIALVPARLLRGHGERLTLLRSPINVPGFDVIAVWHPRVDKDVAHRWLRMRLSQTASDSSTGGNERTP